MAPALIAVVGPTASGKSQLGLRLAREFGGEIVSCDSLQVYRGLDIGSAKPTAAERETIRHHMIDILEPDHPFSAAEYAKRARRVLREIACRGRLPLVVGGTGLYLKALLTGLIPGPSRDEPFRRRLESLADRFGDKRLHRCLARVDPVAAARIMVRDRVRIVRALEVYRATRRPLSELHRGDHRPLGGFAVLTVGLDPGRDVLRGSVERRTREMLEGGLIDEVRGLFGQGFSPEIPPLNAIGYRQAASVLAGRLSLGQAQNSIVTETMRYAKRQRTWFRHQAEVEWFEDAEAAFGRASSWIRAHR